MQEADHVRMTGNEWVAGQAMERTLPSRQRSPPSSLQDRLTLPGPADAATGLQRGDDLDGARILVPVHAHPPLRPQPAPRHQSQVRRDQGLHPGGGAADPLQHHPPPRRGALHGVRRRQHPPGDPAAALPGGGCRFERVELTFKAWRGDAEAIAGHIGENDQRGEMCFWDRAAGIMDIKAALEAQTGGAPSPCASWRPSSSAWACRWPWPISA
jgi:hypothetical protein